jgi:hypothetical protein
MKKSWMILGSAVLSLSLTGCGGDDNARGDDNNNGAKVQSNEVRPIANNRNNNRTLRISDRAERQVERLDQVDDAHVIISNNNAYVTVRLANNQNNNNNANNGNNRNARTSMDNGDNGNARPIMDNGTVNQDGNDGMINGRGDAGNGSRDNKTSDPGLGNGGNLRGDDNNNNNIFGIGNGDNNNNNGNNNNNDNNILGIGNGDNNNNGNNNNNNNNNNENNNNNALGTKEGNQYSKVSNRFEQNIADQVRKADNKIHKVYVSVDPNLYNRMNTYANDIRTNGNRDGLFEDFNATVNDFFGRNNGRNND